ncbi:MAG: aspartate aminotransferase [Rhodobacteraceae bacterium]|nr:aspartate aminotransferase [Paracoccaceae bacterium]MBR25664.1 aspartate aminotransferase [Paracoccaceae bacterium]
MSVPDTVLEVLRGLATPTLANAIDETGAGGVLLGLHAAGPGLRCVGRAVTAREVTGPFGSFPVEDFKVGHMIDAAGPGDVIVVANGGAPVSTWGGMASYAAKLKGIEGLIVDGGVRDREEIQEFGFPVFSAHMVPTPGKTRIRIEAIGEPVVACGIPINPGDIIVADGTGVVALPADRAEEIATLAAGYAKDDAQAMEEMRGGLSFREALAKFAKI